MKLLSKIGILASLLVASNIVLASSTTINFTIINNSLLSFNAMMNTDITNLSPVVERYGGSANWVVSVTDGVLNAFGVYYSATNKIVPCLSDDRMGIMSINTLSYVTGSTITIVVNPSETGAPVCTCIGSVCDVGFA